VAVAVEVGLHRERGGGAVVVDAVAELRRAVVDGRVGVVAVRRGAASAAVVGVAVVIVVLVRSVEEAVAVVVAPVADLGRSRVDADRAVVAVGAAGRRASRLALAAARRDESVAVDVEADRRRVAVLVAPSASQISTCVG